MGNPISNPRPSLSQIVGAGSICTHSAADFIPVTGVAYGVITGNISMGGYGLFNVAYLQVGGFVAPSGFNVADFGSVGQARFYSRVTINGATDDGTTSLKVTGGITATTFVNANYGGIGTLSLFNYGTYALGSNLNMGAGSGTGGGTLNMDGGNITNGGTITAASLVGSGGTFSGTITLSGTAGITFGTSGTLNMNGRDITGFGNLTSVTGKVTAASAILAVATDPSSPVVGQIWFNTVSNTFKYYDGSFVQTIAHV